MEGLSVPAVLSDPDEPVPEAQPWRAIVGDPQGTWRRRVGVGHRPSPIPDPPPLSAETDEPPPVEREKDRTRGGEGDLMGDPPDADSLQSRHVTRAPALSYPEAYPSRDDREIPRRGHRESESPTVA